jgi:NitT/TauT family transport system permease protein
MLEAFQPNKNLSSRAWTTLLCIQTITLLLAWTWGDAFSIPSPYAVGKALMHLVTHEGLLYELGVSMRINVEAIALSTAISLNLAFLTVLPAVRPFVVLCSKARFFSLAGFVTMFTLAFGGGHALKVALLTFGMSVFFITSMAAVVSDIPKADWDQARSLRLAPWRSVLEVVLLGQTDAAFEMLRQNAAMGWAMLTLVEGLVRSEGGIGGILLNSTKYRQFDAVFAVQTVVVLVGLGQDQLIAFLKGVFCPYSNLTLERQ